MSHWQFIHQWKKTGAQQQRRWGGWRHRHTLTQGSWLTAPSLTTRIFRGNSSITSLVSVTPSPPRQGLRLLLSQKLRTCASHTELQSICLLYLNVFLILKNGSYTKNYETDLVACTVTLALSLCISQIVYDYLTRFVFW